MFPGMQNHPWLITKAFVPDKYLMLKHACLSPLQLVLPVVQMKKSSPHLRKVNTIVGFRYTNVIRKGEVVVH